MWRFSAQAHLEPLGKLITLGRKRFEGRAIQTFKMATAATLEVLERLVVEVFKMLANLPVELRQTEEPKVAKARQDLPGSTRSTPFSALDLFLGL